MRRLTISNRVIMRRLREGDTPVVARIDDARVLLDPRTVLPEEDGLLLDALRSAVLA